MSNANKKSISAWVSCTGTSDDTAGATTAFAAAKNNAFTLVVDCPVNIKSGMDIGRIIFIEDGTTVEFTGSGKFTVDNVMHPAFVIANSKNITLIDWNVEFNGSTPVKEDVGGYAQNGTWIAKAGAGQPTNAFNDVRLTPWLKANKGVNFDNSQGSVNSYWPGTTNAMAMFYLVGDSSNINISGMHVGVPATAGGERYVSVVFSFDIGYKSNQTVTLKTPITAQYVSVPHDITFTNTVFDGTYMGFVGQVSDITFDNMQSHRYADLMDANGGNVGGIGKWFAPPHLFYFNYELGGDSALYNSNVQIKNVNDDGPRIGTARDKGGSDTISGFAASLKLGCVDCSVDTYNSSRPDGLMDILDVNNLTVSNVTATYDSSFTNYVFPGWRFPKAMYKNSTFENITLTDVAASTNRPPMGNVALTANENLVFSNVHIAVNKWTASGSILPAIWGTDNNVSLDFLTSAFRVVTVEKDSVTVTLAAAPSVIPVGGTSTLTWSSRAAASCSASGAWSGALGKNGTQIIKGTSAGNLSYTVNCASGSTIGSTTLLANVTAN